MIVEAYNSSYPDSAKINLFYINHMLTERALPNIESKDLPEHGLIAYEKGSVIACGFIRKVEGGRMAILGEFVTNPTIDSATRHRALTIIVGNLEKWAKDHGVEALMLWTVHEDVLFRAEHLEGFRTLAGHNLIKKL